MIKERKTFKSADNKTEISYIIWQPEKQPIAVLQLVHGMIEHIDRYHDFASYLVDKGFAVVGHDHLGHGNSIINKRYWGFFHEEKGNEILLEDILKLSHISKNLYKDKPYFILGHSMGSFLVRQFMFTYPQEKYSGVIIMGTGQKPKALISFGKSIAEIEGKIYGWKKPNKIVKNIFMKENVKPFQPVETPCDWLSKDKEQVYKYYNDMRCNFPFSNRAYYDMFSGMLTLHNNSNLEKLNKEIPYLIISGEDDTVGDFGKGVVKVFNKYNEIGIKDVDLKLFPTDRHEILNELDRDEVYEFIFNWINKKLQ